MLVQEEQFLIEKEKISKLLDETKNAKYFSEIGFRNDELFAEAITFSNNTKATDVVICETSEKRENSYFKIFCPCVLNGKSFNYSPIQFKNVQFNGAIEASKNCFNLLIKISSNKKRINENQIIRFHYLSLDKILNVIRFVNYAAERMNMNSFKYDNLDSPLLFADDSELLQVLISNVKYRIYERYTNRPGRDDHFDLLKGIKTVPKNDYFKKLLLKSVTINSRSQKLSDFVSSEMTCEDNRIIADILLRHESGWTVFPQPTENIEEGNFKIERFLIEIIRKFNKYEFLLQEFKMQKN